jgi:AraC-like DNA-binding protein
MGWRNLRRGEGNELSEVAFATGFADQSHLNRHFKKAYGMTPGQWASLRQASQPGRSFAQ